MQHARDVIQSQSPNLMLIINHICPNSLTPHNCSQYQAHRSSLNVKPGALARPNGIGKIGKAYVGKIEGRVRDRGTGE